MKLSETLDVLEASGNSTKNDDKQHILNVPKGWNPMCTVPKDLRLVWLLNKDGICYLGINYLPISGNDEWNYFAIDGEDKKAVFKENKDFMPVAWDFLRKE